MGVQSLTCRPRPHFFEAMPGRGPLANVHPQPQALAGELAACVVLPQQCSIPWGSGIVPMGRSSHLYRVRESNNSCLRVSPLPGQSLFNVKTLGDAQSLGSESGKGSASPHPSICCPSGTLLSHLTAKQSFRKGGN